MATLQSLVHEPGLVEVTLSGQLLQRHGQEPSSDAFDAVIATHPTALIVNCAGVTLMNHDGAGFLRQVDLAMLMVGGRAIFAGLRLQDHSLLLILGYSDLFEIRKANEEALAFGRTLLAERRERSG